MSKQEKNNVLAQGQVTVAELCQHGCFHVHSGPVSLRLERQAFIDLARTLRLAHDNLQIMEEPYRDQ